MGGPVWPRNRPTLLVAGFGPGVGVGEGARSASSPGWGGWRGAASRVRSRTGGPHLRANDRGGAPSSRRGASCSHRPAPPAATGAAEFQKPGNLPAASPGPPGKGTKPGERPRACASSLGTGRGRAATLAPPRRLLSTKPASRGARGLRAAPLRPSPGDPWEASRILPLAFPSGSGGRPPHQSPAVPCS